MSDLKRTLDLLKKQVAELEAKLTKPEKFEPLDSGYFLDALGYAMRINENDRSGNKWNCFPTEQDALRRQKLREAEDELYNLWLHITGGWEPDWRDKSSHKYFFLPAGTTILHDSHGYKAYPNYRYYQTLRQLDTAVELLSANVLWYLREG